MRRGYVLALGALAMGAGAASAQSLAAPGPQYPAPKQHCAIPAYWHDPNLPNGYSYVPNWPGAWSGYPTNNTNPWFPPAPPYQPHVPAFPAFRVVNNPWANPQMGPPQHAMINVPRAPQPFPHMMMHPMMHGGKHGQYMPAGMHPMQGAIGKSHGQYMPAGMHPMQGAMGKAHGQHMPAGMNPMQSATGKSHGMGGAKLASLPAAMGAALAKKGGGKACETCEDGTVVEGDCPPGAPCGKKNRQLIPYWLKPSYLFPKCECCDPYCPPALWIRGEYLAWWISDGPVPFPLVTTGTSASFGVLDNPGTRVLFGGDQDYGTLSGARMTLGGWLNYNRTFGLEATGFIFAKTSNGFSAESEPNGEPVLAVPFFDVQPGVNSEAALLASAPGAFVGGVGVTSSTQFWNVDGNAIFNLRRGCLVTIDALGGIRYTDLDEDLDLVITNLNVFPGGGAVKTDNFSARNQFYGANLGVRTAIYLGRLGIEGTAKCGIGVTRQTVSIGGMTSFPGLDLIVPGGLFALPTNDGEFHRDAVGVIPEVQLAVSWQFHPNLKGLVGYNFLYWNDVVRPGDQMSRNINATQIPGGLGSPVPTLVGFPLPRADIKGSDFFAHGLSFGLEFDF